MIELPVEEILQRSPEDAPPGEPIGRSREGREIRGHTLGTGPLAVSLIGGCHADEPVGPEMLARLAALLASGSAPHLLEACTWRLVPHVNPDGEARNAAWADSTLATTDHLGAPDRGFELVSYLRHVVREAPGDDVEFGFPRHPDDRGARPENRAVAAFLAPGAPYDLHGSFHGMSFAPGPWFLIEESWAARTAVLRDAVRSAVRRMGYGLFDPDRRGEKGFTRIDAGFTTRPDSRAMAAHFELRGDPATAALFRPSSMEHVRSLGGDPLTLVSEMPLFLLPPAEREAEDAPPFRMGTAGRRELHAWLAALIGERDPAAARAEVAAHGVRPMPIRDQMRLQLAFLQEALRAVVAS